MKPIERLGGTTERLGHTAIHKDKVRFPSGVEGEYWYVERDMSVAILPLIEGEDGLYTLLVRQYRYPIGNAVYQFPMGFIEGTTAPATQAARELEEEAGYEAQDVEPIGEYYHDPGLNSQKTLIFVTKNPSVLPGQSLDDTEEVEVEKVPVASLESFIEEGKICDALMLALVLHLQMYLQKRQGINE